MSKKYEVNLGPFTGYCDGPADIAEYTAVAGSDILADAMQAVIAWSHRPSLENKVCDAIEKATGIARGVDEKATAAAKAKKADADDVKEKAVPYMKRAFASLDEAQQAELKKLVQADVFAKNPIDVGPSTRRSGPGKKAMDKAEEILGRDPAAIEATITKLAEKAPTFVLERDENGTPVLESLAGLIRAYLDANDAI